MLPLTSLLGAELMVAHLWVVAHLGRDRSFCPGKTELSLRIDPLCFSLAEEGMASLALMSNLGVLTVPALPTRTASLPLHNLWIMGCTFFLVAYLLALFSILSNRNDLSAVYNCLIHTGSIMLLFSRPVMSYSL